MSKPMDPIQRALEALVVKIVRREIGAALKARTVTDAQLRGVLGRGRLSGARRTVAVYPSGRAS